MRDERNVKRINEILNEDNDYKLEEHYPFPIRSKIAKGFKTDKFPDLNFKPEKYKNRRRGEKKI